MLDTHICDKNALAMQHVLGRIMQSALLLLHARGDGVFVDLCVILTKVACPLRAGCEGSIASALQSNCQSPPPPLPLLMLFLPPSQPTHQRKKLWAARHYVAPMHPHQGANHHTQIESEHGDLND